MVVLQPTDGASAVTQNRLAEYGPYFYIENLDIHPMHTGLCYRVRTDGGWSGWLPAREVERVTW